MTQCRWFGGTARPELNAGCSRPAQPRWGRGLLLCDLHYQALDQDPEDWTPEQRNPTPTEETHP